MWTIPRLRFYRRRARRGAFSASSRHYRAHKEAARTLVHERLHYWSKLSQIEYGRVAIRNQRARWGSCSSLGNLNFNYRIVFLPIELVDYIVVHELCHRLEFNHSPAFWQAVARHIPDYEARRRALKAIPATHGETRAELRYNGDH